MMEIHVSGRDLLFVLDNRMPGTNHYLDTTTGEVIPVFSYNQNRILKQVKAEPDRFLRLAPKSGRSGYQIMKDFVATVADGNMRARLEKTLDDEHAFRAFRAAIKAAPAESRRWRRYRTDMMVDDLRKRLEERDIRLKLDYTED